MRQKEISPQRTQRTQRRKRSGRGKRQLDEKKSAAGKMRGSIKADSI
jgi:hypothetical protein